MSGSWRPPPPPAVWGPEVWRLLHHAEALGRGARAGHRQTWEFVSVVVRLLPCTCSASGAALLDRLAPGPGAVCKLHNAVNAKLGKAQHPGPGNMLAPAEAALQLVVVVVFLARCRPGADAAALVRLAAHVAPGLHGFAAAAAAVAHGAPAPSLAALGLPLPEHQRLLAASPRLQTLFRHASQ